MKKWKTGVISLGFLGIAGGATAEQKIEDVRFPLRTANGQTVVDCTKLEEDGSIGLEFLQALDRGFHAGNAQYRPAFSRQTLEAHLRYEGLQRPHYQYIETECANRMNTRSMDGQR